MAWRSHNDPRPLRKLAREANRHFAPWLQEATAELTHPQSQERLDEIIMRWRELRTQYFWHMADKRDPTQVRVA